MRVHREKRHRRQHQRSSSRPHPSEKPPRRPPHRRNAAHRKQQSHQAPHDVQSRHLARTLKIEIHLRNQLHPPDQRRSLQRAPHNVNVKRRPPRKTRIKVQPRRPHPAQTLQNRVLIRMIRPHGIERAPRKLPRPFPPALHKIGIPAPRILPCLLINPRRPPQPPLHTERQLVPRQPHQQRLRADQSHHPGNPVALHAATLLRLASASRHPSHLAASRPASPHIPQAQQRQNQPFPPPRRKNLQAG